MKNFNRKNQWLSLCGLNCGLCPMRVGAYCGGCGNGNGACAIARCSLEHGGVEYCYECQQYPCEKYQSIDQYDSFITHKRQKADLEKARQIGIDAYVLEQEKKAELLGCLLSDYNDGRRKTFFCVAVNLLELAGLQEVLNRVQTDGELRLLPKKERCACVVKMLQKIADEKDIDLKLRKKK